MEGMNLGEQPSVQGMQGAGAQSENLNNQTTAKTETQGSSYGKFKDATSLLEAYNNLQSEFTRKSQKLAQLEKETLSKEDDALHKDNSASENREVMYKSATWRQMVADFLAKNPQAKSEAKEMSKILLNNKDIATSKDCLNLAYKLSLANKYVEPASLLNNDEFLEKYVASNPRVQKLIIGNYINSLKNRPTAPATISGEPKSLSKSNAKKISTLTEARKTIEKMFL